MEAAVAELIRSGRYKTHTVFTLTLRDEVDKQDRSVWWVQKAEDTTAKLDAILSRPGKRRLRRDEHPIRALLDPDPSVRLEVERYGDSGSHVSRFVGLVMAYLAEIAEHRRLHGTLPKDAVKMARRRSWGSLLSTLEEVDRDRYRYDVKARRWWYKTLKRETGARAQYLIG